MAAPDVRRESEIADREVLGSVDDALKLIAFVDSSFNAVSHGCREKIDEDGVFCKEQAKLLYTGMVICGEDRLR